MSEYEAERAAVRANTERLRALRLARDAAQKAGAQAAPAKPAPKTRPAPKTKTAPKTKSVKRSSEPSAA